MRESRKLVQGKEVQKVLRAVPKCRFSHDFDVFDPAGIRVATADLYDWRENARLEVRGRRYLALHHRWAKEFTLEGEDGLTMAEAVKPSAWRETFSVEHEGERYELKKESPWRSSFVLSREGVGVVASIRRKSIFGRETSVELNEELPVEVVVFSLWLTTTMSKRGD